ncbi:3-hydroxybutyryl-CoA dehydratase [Siccirubricoccus deserti]|uniref:Enoyl-CoA hydratase/isomerase family protein n=1 Tax=Siccirubricoccus deserti TaxID=2013562 RepID=A0A9X0UDM6_9PROT|nr:enoyl-CoA hydratase-related protein [Siccirubricoccus deserti]MBC4016602.1 enoyl-CoA hydratase/isomerase family protein [Siccirubricoccus deserti]GGC50383.1 3-hydroxybutyryl-CoA dehydratase [Siccirubricoccus deserti]
MLLDRSYSTLLLDAPAPGILQVTLNRPERANAFTSTMGEEILQVFQALEADPAAYRCVVLTGAGNRAFCAGADLKERNGMTDEQFSRQHYLFERMARAVLACPMPLLGAVNGAAFAGGLELALCCDFLYASETARFALTEVTLGIMPGAGGTQNLPRTIGERRAKEVILTGKPFSAQDALAWGMVNKLYPAEEVLAAVLETAQAIAANAPLSVRQAKKSISQGLQMDRASGMLFEIEAYYQLIPTEDRNEGIRAFNEKRKPNFKGR